MSNSRQAYHSLRVFPGHIVPGLQSVEITVPEYVTTRKVLKLVLVELEIQEAPEKYELVEVCVHDDQSAHGPRPSMKGDEDDSDEEEEVFELQTTERVLSFSDNPVRVCQSWRKMGSIGNTFRLFLREKHPDMSKRSGTKGSNRLTLNWMDCHEFVHLRNDWHFQFDVHSNLDDDDLCRLPDLNEQTLLEKLFQRFERGKIYTYVGEILIAVNPYKFFPIYNPKYINAYQNRRLGELQPHIFAIADEAFHRMLKERKDQCVVISGESGSGKTESTKLLLHHLTALSHKTGMETTSVEKTILGAGPVLEAFGNAKTASNNNSSRFGKFTEVKFREDGTVSGAILRKYLLEKSRIVTQAVGERNYHVFYYLLAGANEVESQEFYLKTSEFYTYLNKTGCFELEGVDEAYEFLRFKQSMDMVGFSSDTQRKIFRVLSAVLWIGNVEFVRKHSYDDVVTLKEKDGGDKVLTTISNLLMLKKEKFVSVLTSRKKKTRTEQIVMSYKLEEAVDTRDALAKALYGALFDWIVLQVNHTLAMRYNEMKEMKGNSIGVLDIFGFEVFEHNSFEQFCINYANEKLQFYFNHHVFRMEQDEYKAEGIGWYDVSYVDNSSCLDLIHGKPTGLFQLLDEESGLSGNVASDTTLLAKFQRHHDTHRSFETSLIEPTFTIVHYAGKVTYDIKNFRAKNKDLMRPEIVSILKNSQMRFIRELLGADPMAIYRWAIVRNYFRAIAAFQKYGKRHKQENHEKRSKALGRRESPLKVVADTTVIDEQYVGHRAAMIKKASKMVRKRMKSFSSPEKDIERIRKGLETKKDMSIKTFDYLYRGTSKRNSSLKNPPTVTAQFQLSLNRLMEILDESKPFFVRCIRSNAEKAALEFTKELVLSQLRYTGMLETIRIRKLGYHVRFQYEDFYTNFGLLLPRGMKTENLRENLGDVFCKLGLDQDQFQLGKSKVFFREKAYELLMTKIEAEIGRRVTQLQRWFRAMLCRKQFLQKRAAAVIIQDWYRERFEYRNKAAIKIQAAWRMHLALREHRKAKKGEERSGHFLFHRPKSPSSLDKNGEQLDVVEESDVLEVCGQANRQAMSSTDLTSEICRQFPELEEEIKYATVPRYHRDEGRISPLCSQSPEETDKLEQESGNDDDLVVINGCESVERSEEDSAKSVTFGSDGSLSSTGRTAPVNPRLNRRRTGSLKSIRKRLSVQRRSTIGSGENRSSSDDIDDTSNEQLFRDREDEPERDKEVKESEVVNTTSKKRTPFFRRKPKAKDKLNRRTSEPAGPTEKFDLRPLKRHSDERLTVDRVNLGQEIESPTGARQLKGDASVVLEGSEGLEEIDKFLSDKIHDFNKGDSKQDTIVDKVFKKAVQEFHSSLISTYSVMMKQNDTTSITSEDLVRNFENILINIIKVDKIHVNFPVAMGLNAFVGLLNEFKTSWSQSGPKLPKQNKRKPIAKHKKKKQDIIEYGDHTYALMQFNIYTFCEHCNNMIWILEKGLVCQECKFTCHKRCYKKYKVKCGKHGRKKSVANASVFGNHLCELVSDDIQIPTVVVKLITEIENKGLFSEGIYRKSPSAAQVKQLKNLFTNTKDANKVDLGNYAIHVVAGVLKLFFRTLPSPIITEELYDEFLRACDLSDSESRLMRLHTLIDTLPKPNQDTLERLIFHLARVAKYEESNLMSPSGLSVIWAPCLMRPREGGSALDGLYDIRRQSMIVESLIVGQMAKISATLVDIKKIDQAFKNTTAKLSRLNIGKDADCEVTESNEQQKKFLNDQLERLEKQKALLTANLSTLTPHSSLVFEEENSSESENDNENENGTSDEIDGEKKESPKKNVAEDNQERAASGGQSEIPLDQEQPSSKEQTISKRSRPRKAPVNTLSKHYMDSSDSQDSLDSIS